MRRDAPTFVLTATAADVATTHYMLLFDNTCLFARLPYFDDTSLSHTASRALRTLHYISDAFLAMLLPRRAGAFHFLFEDEVLLQLRASISRFRLLNSTDVTFNTIIIFSLFENIHVATHNYIY